MSDVLWRELYKLLYNKELGYVEGDVIKTHILADAIRELRVLKEINKQLSKENFELKQELTKEMGDESE